MKKAFSFCFFLFILILGHSISFGKEVPKIAVWDLVAGNLTPSYAQDLTSILVSEITKLGKYEVYSQDNVRTLAGWTAERMHLGCTDTKCLTALGQMDISKLISGRIGKIGNRFSVSLNLFDTQNAKAENAVSELGRSEDELIDLVQVAVHKLLGEQKVSSSPSGQVKAAPPPPAPPASTSPPAKASQPPAPASSSPSATFAMSPQLVQLRLSNVDDIGRAFVNGQQVSEIICSENTCTNDTGWIDVTNRMKPGRNIVIFNLDNGQYGGWRYRFQLSAAGKKYDSGIVGRNACPCNAPVLKLEIEILVSKDGTIESISEPEIHYF